MENCNGTLQVICPVCAGEKEVGYYESSYYEQYAREWEEPCVACTDENENPTGQNPCEGCADCWDLYDENGELIAEPITE